MQLVGVKTSPAPSPSGAAGGAAKRPAAVAQQAIEAAGFRFAGSFVANPFYPKDVVFKAQPLAPGKAPQVPR